MPSHQSHAPEHWLLLRGLGRERGHWFQFPESFAASLKARVHTLDLPGAGQRRRDPVPPSISAIAQDVAARLEPLARGASWGVLGISLGGMVGLALAAGTPDRVSHVVAINCSSGVLSFAHQRLRPRGAVHLVRALVTRDPEQRERAIYGLTTNAPMSDVRAWARRAAQLARRAPPSRRAVLHQLLAARRFEPGPITQPLLVLSGTQDRLVSPACSIALARRLGGTHRGHPNAGHDLPIEDPEWVIEQVRDWLAAMDCVKSA